MPANDCKACLYTLSGIQMVSGMVLLWGPGRGGLNKAATVRAAQMGSVVRPSTVWKNRFLQLTGILTGSYLVFMASLELIRLPLPNDPWVKDAAIARQQAKLKNGGKEDVVSWWLGPKGYRAIEYKEWKRRMDLSLSKEEVSEPKWKVVRDIHSDIRERNRALARQILEEGLEEVDIDSSQALPHPVFTEPEDSEPEPVKQKKTKANEDGNDEGDVPVWYAMNPWETLRDDIDVQIRIMPHTREVDSIIEDILDEEEPKLKECTVIPLELSFKENSKT